MEQIKVKKLYGNIDGKIIYSVILLDEDDLSGCTVRLYRANSFDEVADFLKDEEIDERNYLIDEIGSI